MSASVIVPSSISVVVTAPDAIPGLGYVPDSDPPADPPGVTPLMVMLLAAVILPLLSTVYVGTCVALP